jgi:hypothetical protein
MPVLAASPKVEVAIKTIRAVAADPNQRKMFCALLEMADKKNDPKAEAAIDGYVKQLGTEFEAAWDVVESIDENSSDGQAIDAVLDEVDDKSVEASIWGQVIAICGIRRSVDLEP